MMIIYTEKNEEIMILELTKKFIKNLKLDLELQVKMNEELKTYKYKINSYTTIQ